MVWLASCRNEKGKKKEGNGPELREGECRRRTGRPRTKENQELKERDLRMRGFGEEKADGGRLAKRERRFFDEWLPVSVNRGKGRTSGTKKRKPPKWWGHEIEKKYLKKKRGKK